MQNTDKSHLTEHSSRLTQSANATVLYTMYVDEKEPVADWVSENIKDITGYNEQTVLKKGWWSEQIHPDDRQVESQANEALLTQGYLIYEYRWKFADGTYHWIRDEMRIIQDENSKTTRVYGVWRDITSEMEAQQKLEEQEERLRFTLQATGDGLWDWNIKTNEIYWSATNYDMLGMKRSEFPFISYSKWQSIVHPDDLKRTEALIREALKIDGDKLDTEFRFYHADDYWLWIACRGQVVEWDEDGNPARMLGLHTDISERKEWEYALKEREKLLNQITKQVPGMLYQFVKEPDGHMYFPFSSAHIKDIYGVSPEQAREDAWNAAAQIHPDDLDTVLNTIDLSGKQLTLWRQEYRVLLPGKGERWVRGEARPEKQTSGNLVWHGYIMDITDEKEAEKDLKVASSVFKNTHDGIMVTSVDGTIIEINPTFTRITGYSRDEIIGQQPSILSSGKHEKAFYTDMWQSLLHDGLWQGEVWNRRKNGSIYCERKTISAVYDDLGNIEQFVGIFSDVTLLKQQQERLEQLAHYDPLTNLPNRTLLNDRLYMAVEAAKRSGNTLTLVYVDLDDFKPVNDTYGHAAGDYLLEVVAKRLSTSVRKSDTVARIGGDEFIVLLNHESDNAYHPLIERLQKYLQQPVNIQGNKVRVSSSIGMANFPDDAQDPELLIRYADRAMYAAKQSGKNKAIEYSELTEDS
ncbi:MULTISPECIES: bifunctional diguanylate cyclase/phosphodiesterase [Gammaproteobacteria]|uniref:sensor domain-containing protein n=1 Tax=Gammaproteobacteria TaxID=1236 RepID=UPI000DD09EB6|nr:MULTISPECIES: PAS domain-containing protein [Gammaproteobacteria]RTE87514.1 diguanylate cyclase [Aliidiomarina sp. B3213]TCZ92701.1 diguanylate cyclase [Lysobacter sp. N42]